jgi:hypothetical protein
MVITAGFSPPLTAEKTCSRPEEAGLPDPPDVVGSVMFFIDFSLSW